MVIGGLLVIITGANFRPHFEPIPVTPTSLSFTGAQVSRMLSLAKAVTIYNTGTTSLTVNSYSLSPEFVDLWLGAVRDRTRKAICLWH